jgi:hypothetical protein
MSGDWRDYIALDDAALLAQCEVDRFRASGPGGQKRNKTESAVRLRHAPTGLQGEANESRSQHENRARALRRLRLTLALTLRAPVDLEAYEATPLLSGALERGPSRRSPDLLAVLGELFDVLEASTWRIGEASAALGVPSASISRILQIDDDVWRAAAQRRQALGLAPLRSQG